MVENEVVDPSQKKSRKQITRKVRIGKVETAVSMQKAEKINSFIGHLAKGMQEVVTGVGEIGAFKSKKEV